MKKPVQFETNGERAGRARAVLERWFQDEYEVPEQAPVIIAEICELMVNESISLSRICKEKLVEGVPSLATVMFWQRAVPQIGDALRAAREARAEVRWDSLEEEIRDQFFPIDPETGERGVCHPAETKAKAAFVRTISDNRKFEVSKLIPRIYGDEAPVSRGQFDSMKHQMQEEGATIVVIPPKGSTQHKVKELRDESERLVEGYASTVALPSGE